MDGGQPKKNYWRVVALLIGIGTVLGLLVFGSIRSVQAECSLCVEFRGERQCRTGAGATQEDARAAAQRAACAVMASGMDESIACTNVPPVNVQCPSD